MSLQLETLTNNDAEQKCEQYTLTNPSLLTKPADLPEGYIATNPVWYMDDHESIWEELRYYVPTSGARRLTFR